MSGDTQTEDVCAWMDEIHAFLYPLLNELHGAAYSERFWKVFSWIIQPTENLKASYTTPRVKCSSSGPLVNGY